MIARLLGASVLASALGLLAGIAACHERSACAPAALADLEAAYVAEAITACAGKTRATCEAMPAIERKYAAKREEWIQCR